MLSLKEYIKHPRILFTSLLREYGGWIPDKQYLQMMYYLKVGKRLNLENPQTFNEKLQWLKLYNRKPEYTMMVDKYAVKDYVASIIGEEYIIPTLGVWERPEDIDFDNLPNQFVLKTTHGGGSSGVVICRDKYSFDTHTAIKKLRLSMKQDLYQIQREWPYKDVKRRIIAEKYMEDSESKELSDFKFFTFHGKVKALFVGTERGTGDVKFDFYDADFNHLPFYQEHPMSGKIIKKPYSFNKMKGIAEKLSAGLPHVRIDLYEVDGKVYFGEYTFSHHAGMVPFHPEDWDYKFGSWLYLPTHACLSNKYLY